MKGVEKAREKRSEAKNSEEREMRKCEIYTVKIKILCVKESREKFGLK